MTDPRAWTRLSPRTIGFGLIAVAILAISAALTVARRGTGHAAPRAIYPGSDAVRPMPSVLPATRLPGRVRVAILRDRAAASYYTQARELDAIVERWRRALAATGAEVTVAHDAGATAVRAAQVIVIPSSPCLEIASRAAIERALAQGQGLILAGIVGTHDAGCRSIGYGLLASLTGASRIERLEQRPMVYVTVPDGSPLAVGVPPGARLDVGPGQQVALRHPARAAYYSDYALVPRPAREQPLVDGAIVPAESGRSRIVYWGFELHEIDSTPWSQAIAALLVRNSIAWAARLPWAAVEPWPDGRAAAAVLAQDVEDRFANARYALDSLRAAGVRSTFFLTSDIARRHRRLTQALADMGEVGTHSENHRTLGGMTPELLHERLTRTRGDLARLIDRPVHGLRPPEEQFDRATMAAWLAAGGSYMFGANDSRVAAPELLAIDGDTLVMLGRVTHDDFSGVGPRGSRDPHELTEVFLEEFAKVRALGGFYILSYHSQLMARPEMVPSLARLARTIAADSSVWLATAGEVAAWWRARGRLRVSVERRATDVLEVRVHNEGPDAVAGAVVRVALGASQRVASAGVPVLSAGRGLARLELPALGAGGTRTFVVRMRAADAFARFGTAQ